MNETELTDIRRCELDALHAMTVTALRQLDQVRKAAYAAFGGGDRAAVAAEQSHERLQVTLELLERLLGIKPIGFDVDHVTYDIVRDDQRPQDAVYVVLCDGERIAEFELAGDAVDTATEADLIAWGRDVVAVVERGRALKQAAANEGLRP